MKKIVLGTALLSLLAIAGFALAGESTGSGAMKTDAMTMPKPGPESLALGRFFGANWAWTGEVAAGAMGPDSKATTSHGKAMCRPLYGGMWYGCQVEETMGSGKDAMTWQGHMMVGYDTGAKAYRAMTVDNMGMMTTYEGSLDGDRFVLTTPTEVMMMGQMMKDRLTWEVVEGGMKFTDEHQTAGGDWMVAETAMAKRMKTAPKGQNAAMKVKQ